jgi:hypothetical protein
VLYALTVKEVPPGGVAGVSFVVVIVNVDVFEVSPGSKESEVGLKEGVTPVGKLVVTQRPAVNSPVLLRFTVIV